jgi:hypothetical protein
MLAIKKKREQEKKAAAAAAAAAATEAKDAPAEKKTQKVSLLGIGGKKKEGSNSKGGKRRTAGEIRIQKGRLLLFFASDKLSDTQKSN